MEILDKNAKNMVVGCIYRHPCMSVSEFNDEYLCPLLEKLGNEKKQVILMGDFNISLLNYDTQTDTNGFLNLMHSHSLIPFILKPTRLTAKTKTLIDNIFTNIIDIPHTSGNLTYSIADHLPQFVILETTSPIKKKSKSVFKRDFNQYVKDCGVECKTLVSQVKKLRQPKVAIDPKARGQ